MTDTIFRRDAQSRLGSFAARVGWAIFVCSIGCGIASLPVYVVALIGEGLDFWATSWRLAALSGIVESGLAAAFALLVARPTIQMGERSQRLLLVAIMAVAALPIAVVATLAFRPGVTLTEALAVGAIRVVGGSAIAVSSLFVGGLSIGRPWWRTPWSALAATLFTAAWLVPLASQMEFSAAPSLALVGLWLGTLGGAALISFRFYAIDSDLRADASWSRVVLFLGVIGLAVASVVVVQAAG